MPGLHFHDLRHTGNTLASRTTVGTKDLMVRVGHESPRAALIYQHASSEEDRRIAASLSELVDAQRAGEQSDPDEDDGRAGVRVPAR
jgi:integrase